MAANVEIYDSGLTAIISTLQDIGDLTDGTTTSIITIKLQNDGDSLATKIKLFARCLNGLYTSQSNSIGQEAITEQWVQVDTGGGFTAIGGNFADGVDVSPAGNYVTVADLAAGAATADIDFQIVIPSGVTTAGEIFLQFGVEYKE